MRQPFGPVRGRTLLVLTTRAVLLAGLVALAGCGEPDAKDAIQPGPDADGFGSDGALQDVGAVDVQQGIDGLVKDGALPDADNETIDGAALDAGPTNCTAIGQCTGAKPVCDFAAGLCVACVQDGDCATGSVCLGKACGAPLACTSDKECVDLDAVCDKALGHCVDCLSDGDCTTEGLVCTLGHCVAKPPACTSSKDCAVVGGVCDKAKGSCAECTSADDCVDARYCKQGVCVPDICTAGQTQCNSPTELGGCNAEGSGYESTACKATEACYEGACKPKICTPGDKVCTAEGVKVCNARGVGLGAATPCQASEACKDGACLPKVCAPGETTCKDGVLATCEPEGTAWASGKCKQSVPGALGETCGSKDGKAACVPMICAPKSLVCAGSKPAICDDDGLGNQPSGDCKVLPDGGPGTCAGGVCLPDACTGTATTCAGAAVVGCKDGSWATTPCGSGEGCKNGACEKVVCVADEVYCAGTVRLQCDKSGTSPATLQDCAADGKTCKDGACVPTVCKPGSVVCSGDGSATETCNALGLATVKTSCPSQHICVGGGCVPVICEAGTTFCSNNNVVQCNSSGTSTSTLESCKSGTTCKSGACVPWVCTPGSKECAGDQLSTCDADGLGKTAADCPSGQICDGLGCKAVVCDALQKGCDGSKAGQCNAKGTGWIGQQDCAANKLYCVAGTCSSQVCKPNETACVGTAVGVCQADGLGWKSKVECDDNDACTSNGCKDGGCLYGAPKVCDDNQPCTTDWCDKASGKCLSSPKTGSCDDGNLCTSGDTCTDGTCQAGPGMVSTLAGTGQASFADGSATSARFYYPEDVESDDAGTIYVADSYNNRIRTIATNGTVTTLAGNGSASYLESTGTSARFYRPYGIALASTTLYVADSYNNRIRTIDLQTKQTKLLAGNGSAAYKEGVGAAASFSFPTDVAVLLSGDLVVADRSNHRLRRIDATGTVTTLSGTSAGYADGNAASAMFSSPDGVAVAANGTIYVADLGNHRIRRITGGVVTTVAGSGINSGIDGIGTQATFSSPRKLAIDATGALLVADSGSHRIRRVTPSGVVTTLSGSVGSFVDGPAATATFNFPASIAIRPNGDVVIADRGNHRIRRLVPGTTNCDDGAPCTADACDPKTGACSHAPIAAGKACDDGDACTSATVCDSKGGCTGKAKDCSDNNPCTNDTCNSGTGECGHAAHDEACNDGDACSLGDACVGGVCKAGVGTIAAVLGTGVAGVVDGTIADARTESPVDAAERTDGTLAVVERYRVRLVAADGTTVSTLAGPSTNLSGTTTGYGPISRFQDLRSVAAWPDDSLRVADSARIVRVGVSGYTTLLAGAPNNSASYVDGKGDAARFNGIRGLARRTDGGLVIVEEASRRVRLLTPDGNVSTLAGSGQAGYQDGPTTSAMFHTPRGVAIGSDGAIYVADAGNRRIRKIFGGTVSTVAGSGQSGTQDGAATSATFPDLWDLAVLPGGRIAIATNAALRLYDPANNGTVGTLLASGGLPFAGFGTELGLHVAKANLRGLAFGSDDRLWGVEAGHQVRVLRFGKAACDDGSPCTTDSCDKQKGCLHAAKAKGSACDDGSKCTATSACNDKGECAGTAKNCDDGNVCSIDGCDPDLGSCTHDPSLGGCNDGSACTTGEACSVGVCSSQPLVLTTVAGVANAAGYVDGAAADARFTNVGDIDADASGVVVADSSNHLIRRYAAGTVSTVAGTPKTAGFQDGAASSAKFSSPQGVAIRADGAILVADTSNHRIRQIIQDQVATHAGSTAGYVDGPVASAQFSAPHDVLFDANARLWVSDRNNNRIRRILPSGTVETVAGGSAGFQDGPGSSAKFNGPRHLSLGPDKASVYVADYSNFRVRKVAPDGSVSTVLGNGINKLDPIPAVTGAMGAPTGITFDSAGAMIVGAVDPTTRVLLRVDAGKVEIYFGEVGKQGITDGILGEALLYGLMGLDRGPDGTIWLADGNGLRAVLSKAKNCDDGSPCTTDSCDAKTGACSNTKLATGSACTDGTACTSGDACDAGGKCVGKLKDCSDGNVCTADNCDPFDGSCGHPYVDGTCNDGSACTTGEACALGKCQTGPGMVETLAGDGTSGYVDGAALTAKLTGATGVAARSDGSVVFSDFANQRIRLLKDGKVSTIAGDGTAGYLDGKGLAARFSTPRALALRPDGSIVVHDGVNRRMRLLAPDGTVSTLAGSGQAGAQDGFPTSASFGQTGGLTQKGEVTWFFDTENHRVRTIAKDGTVATFAGSSAGYIDGPIGTARFNQLAAGALAGSAVYVADAANHRIRKIAAGVVTTVAGSTAGYLDGLGAAAQLSYPRGLVAAPDGSFWILDIGNRRIRRLQADGNVTTIAGSGTKGSIDGFATAATFEDMLSLAWKPGSGAIVGTAMALRLVRSPTKVCDDGNPCTVDACDAKTGACSAPKASDGAACQDDGKPCVEAMTCKTGVCQGGKAKSCDDGDTCTLDTCDAATGACSHAPDNNAGCTAIRRVFVTSEAFAASLGGLAGAHAKCQAIAEAKGLGGTWYAWLSDSSNYPAQYHAKFDGPYRLLNGTEIAKNWSDLTDGSLAAPINIDENGNLLVNKSSSYCNGSAFLPAVWTASTPQGTRANTGSSIYYCNNWGTTTSSSSYRGPTGKAGDTGTSWSQACTTQRCNYKAHLYCFDQTDSLKKN